MTTIDFTNWLHTELHKVFNHDVHPGQVMLKAIPMIHELVSQNKQEEEVCSMCGGSGRLKIDNEEHEQCPCSY